MYELKEVAALRGSVIGADHHVLRIRARRVPERGSPPRSFTVTRGQTAIHAELGPICHADRGGNLIRKRSLGHALRCPG